MGGISADEGAPDLAAEVVDVDVVAPEDAGGRQRRPHRQGLRALTAVSPLIVFFLLRIADQKAPLFGVPSPTRVAESELSDGAASNYRTVPDACVCASCIIGQSP